LSYVPLKARLKSSFEVETPTIAYRLLKGRSNTGLCSAGQTYPYLYDNLKFINVLESHTCVTCSEPA